MRGNFFTIRKFFVEKFLRKKFLKKSGENFFVVLCIYKREDNKKNFRGKIFSGYLIYKRENNKRKKNRREITYIRERRTYIREETNKNFGRSI